MRRNWLPVLFLLLLPPPAAASELAIDWNRTVLELAEAEDGFLTLKGVRTAALLHAAMYGALAGAGEGADARAAAIEAAWRVARDQYPDRDSTLTALRERQLSGGALEAGRARGQAAARAVLDRREGDGWDNEAEYRWHPMGPGVYAEFSGHSNTPEGFVFGAGWATARPFVLESPAEFRSPPPPAIDSEEYARAFDEVKELGRTHSDARTDDQTHLAMWWKEFVESSHNRLARELVAEEGLGLREASRLFARLNMAVFDAYVSVFENKFHHNHWRPYTAIRWAAHDGNPRTVPEEDWDNLHRHTYAFPSFPSAHGCASAAAMTVLAEQFGEDRPFTMTIPQVDSAGPFSPKVAMDPPTRRFDSFAAAALECAMSRLYLGIHFRYDSVEGYALGQRVGEAVLERWP